MAEHANITRRAALVGALVSSAALAAPVAKAVAPSENAIDRFHHHFAGLVAAMDEIASDADGWGLQCGRTAEDKRVWRNQQRRFVRIETVTNSKGATLDVPTMRQTDLMIGKVIEG